ncbi:MAG: hypothetical protein V1689_13365 [Pseudomonadota bacterium]
MDESEKREGFQNADYLLPGAILELKIIEEEGLEKESRQNKIKKLFTDKYILPKEVDIDIKRIPDEIKPRVDSNAQLDFATTIGMVDKISSTD